MKKSALIQILLIVFLSTSVFTINAQDKDKVAKIGIRAGWNYASIPYLSSFVFNTHHFFRNYVYI